MFDNDLDIILQSTLQGRVERKINILTTLVYSLGLERFGTDEKESQPKPAPNPNRREREKKKVREELNSLRKRYKKANEVERKGLAKLREELRSRLKILTTAERLRRKRRERTRKRAAFIANPYKFTKTLLGEERGGSLQSDQEEVAQYLREVHSDPEGAQPLGDCDKITPADHPQFPLDLKEPTLQEVRDVVKKARACSAPGLSGIPYKVYKKCPKLLRRLWLLLRAVWKKGSVPECWQAAEGCFAPKEKDSKNVKQFRTISLLSVKGKIFFSILARRLTIYMTTNTYIDTSVQKGGIPGFSGCVEHTSALTQLLHEARINKKNLMIVWLDLANAYGSIPHQLIQEALQHYHVPEHARSLIRSYYSNIHLRFSCKSFTTSWISLEKGIVTGCSISVILFVMGMNMILKAGERETRGPLTNAGIHLPANRGFMDDLTTETHIQARWILNALDETVTWARMVFKPKKSRCLVVKKGKVTTQFKLFIQGEEIPSLVDNPIKCLGKWFDSTLSDKSSKGRIRQQLDEGLRRIDRAELPGKFKSWIYQHGLLPRLVWPLMVNEIPVSLVEQLEQAVSKHIRRWLGLPPSFSSIGLYGRCTKLQMPLTSLVEEYKVAKARLFLTLRDSADQKISKAGIEIRTGRKWSASKAVEQAESSLHHQVIVGATNKGREGLGHGQQPRWEKADSQERRSMVQQEIRRSEDTHRSARSVQMGQQGCWSGWNLPERKLTWSELWQYEPLQLSFLLRSVYDLLPTPTNLERWKLSDDPSCPLCSQRGTLAHVLSSCPVALSQGRYRWRHDQVLRVLADILEQERRKERQINTKGPGYINFVREGQKAKGSQNTSLLQEARHWKMKVDLQQKLVFPDVVQTNLRPDIVIWSTAPKKMILLELTVPWEERTDEANERKRSKYQELADMCRERGYTTWIFPVEVGCRGFPAQSVWKALGALGIKGSARKSSVRALGKAAERASSWLWLRRNEMAWKPSQTSSA